MKVVNSKNYQNQGKERRTALSYQITCMSKNPVLSVQR